MALVIELENKKDGLLTLCNEHGSHNHVSMQATARLVVTSEQFNLLAYDIEGHAEGKFGVGQDLEIYLIDTESNARERISFADAKLVLIAGASSDSAAAELQAEKAAKQKARREAKLKTQALIGDNAPDALRAGASPEQIVTALIEN